MSYFSDVAAPIRFEGPASKNPLAFKRYDPEKQVGDKSMREHLRFAVCYWHTFVGTGADPFGEPTLIRPWKSPEDRLEAAFEFFEKLGVGFWTFHDRDLAPEADDFAASSKKLESMVQQAKALQERSDVKLLWGTANLFSHPRYMCGAATNPDPRVFAYAAAQVKRALEATHELRGAGYVFWGGREGYDTLLNTDLKREREQLARFLRLAIDYAKEIGFEGRMYIEPKPHEPTKHQYDSNAESCLNFLREFELINDLWLNLETNHATLAGHSMQHEMQVARLAGRLGSVDANVGDTLLGWDTDQFPTDIYGATYLMLEILRNGGIAPGGLNFDAKVRRASHEPIDLFHAHIGAMDTMARGLEIAHAILDDGTLDSLVAARYEDWSGPIGQEIESGGFTLQNAERITLANGEPKRRSGRQEMLENMINSYL